jgi:hypothetical protein
LERRLGGLQSWPGHGGGEQNSWLLLGLEPPIIPPIAQCYTTELSQLLLEQRFYANTLFHYKLRGQDMVSTSSMACNITHSLTTETGISFTAYKTIHEEAKAAA